MTSKNLILIGYLKSTAILWRHFVQDPIPNTEIFQNPFQLNFSLKSQAIVEIFALTLVSNPMTTSFSMKTLLTLPLRITRFETGKLSNATSLARSHKRAGWFCCSIWVDSFMKLIVQHLSEEFWTKIGAGYELY